MLITDKGKKILNKHNFNESSTEDVWDSINWYRGKDRQIHFYWYEDEIKISYVSVIDPTEDEPYELNIPKWLEEIKKEITVEEDDL